MRKRFEATPSAEDPEQIHVGFGHYIHEDIWDTMLRKNDSKFIKELCTVYYGTEGLKKKCMDKSRVHVNRESREEISPERLELMSDLLYKKITDSGVKGYKRQFRLNKMGDYISDKLYDVQRKKK